jgi:hypothetical protein
MRCGLKMQEQQSYISEDAPCWGVGKIIKMEDDRPPTRGQRCRRGDVKEYWEGRSFKVGRGRMGCKKL